MPGPWSGRSPGGGDGNPFQCSRLGNPRTEEPGGLQFFGLQSQTRLKGLRMHTGMPHALYGAKFTGDKEL